MPDPLLLYTPWNSPVQNTGVGSLSLLQEIFPTQELNSGLLHCRQIIYQLSLKGSPRILEWVAHPFSSILTQELNEGLLHCRQILYQLSYKGILKWSACDQNLSMYLALSMFSFCFCLLCSSFLLPSQTLNL